MPQKLTNQIICENVLHMIIVLLLGATLSKVLFFQIFPHFNFSTFNFITQKKMKKMNCTRCGKIHASNSSRRSCFRKDI